MTSRLTRRNYWDSVHVGEQEQFSAAVPVKAEHNLTFSKRFAGALKKFLGKTVLDRLSNYDDYLLWNVILPGALPNLNGAACLEIGSAPGDHVVQFSRAYGCTPYGVEYSSVGVELNREVFRQNNVDPDNVIFADFFSEDFIAGNREKFDVVISNGFIEHFDDVKSVIDRHVQLVKPGGYLIIGIPNLRGANYFLTSLFDEGAIPRHNLTIMRKAAYCELFDRKDLNRLFCDYYGTFTFYLYTAGQSPVRRYLLRICHRIQPLLNLAMRSVLGRNGAETALLSPFLLYIGRKSDSAVTQHNC
jgi:2-polyprenyl-3-methyl-5-hydroxy-6-metoxy-1,4-benzoquinol methylase